MQYDIVKRETNTSTVCEFGDLSMRHLRVSDFQGLKRMSGSMDYADETDSCGRDAVSSPSVPRSILERKMAVIKDPELRRKAKGHLLNLLAEQAEIEATIRQVAKKVGSEASLIKTNLELTHKHDCYYEIVQSFHDQCYNLGKYDWAMTQLYVFVNMCEISKISQDQVVQAIHEICSTEPKITII